VKVIDRELLNVKQVCDYTGWGATKVREIIKRPDSTFTIRLGNRLYVDKNKFDEFLDRCIRYQIRI